MIFTITSILRVHPPLTPPNRTLPRLPPPFLHFHNNFNSSFTATLTLPQPTRTPRLVFAFSLYNFLVHPHSNPQLDPTPTPVPTPLFAFSQKLQFFVHIHPDTRLFAFSQQLQFFVHINPEPLTPTLLPLNPRSDPHFHNNYNAWFTSVWGIMFYKHKF